MWDGRGGGVVDFLVYENDGVIVGVVEVFGGY